MQNTSPYRIRNVNNTGLIEFVLFLDPYSQEFYSFSPQKGILIQEKTPQKLRKQVYKQINQLKIIIDHKQWPLINSFQRRLIPINYLIESKYKYPLYSTHEQLSKAMLEDIKFNENSILMKDQIIDFIQADIYLTQIQDQLQYTRKQRKIVDKISTNIKLIASINQVILTLGRVILQDYSVVVSTLSPKNKLIFRVKGKNQYLYGNDALMNFECIRAALKKKQKISLEIIEASVYDKEQYTKFFFNRQADDVKKGQFAAFPWDQLLNKHPQVNFLMWYGPNQYSLDPNSIIDYDKLYSPEQLTRANEKIKLKLQRSKRRGIRKIPRYLWKVNILSFLQKRRNQIQSNFVELDNSVIYSGQLCTKFQFKIVNLHNLFGLFKQQNFVQGKSYRRGYLKFLNKQAYEDTNFPQNLPTANQRFIRFSECKKQVFIDVVPYMITIVIEYCYGNQVIYKDESQPVIASAHVSLNQKIVYSLIANLMMEMSIIFKIKVHSKEGQGTTCGVGVLKLFDQFGYLLQGKQEVQLMAASFIDMNKIGCLSQTVQFNKTFPFLTVQLPVFRKPVIWSLKDKLCLKHLGYLPQSQQSKQPHDQEQNFSKLHQILSYNPLKILKLTPQQKKILKKNYKYYKNQSQKLIYYIYSIDWTNPYEVAEAYQIIYQWQYLKPVQALFLLNPKIADQKIRYFAIEKIQKMYEYEFICYSNQITQCLVSFQTDDNPLIDLIIQKSCYEPYTVGQQYFWQFRNRLNQQHTQNRFTMYIQSLAMTSYVRDIYVKQVQVDEVLYTKNQQLIEMTEKIKQFQDKKPLFKSFVPEIQRCLLKVNPKGFHFPIRPENTFKKIVSEQSRLFNSKKMPFCLSCISTENSQQKPYKVIYKCGDDINQDHLVLQMFSIFQKLWAQNGFDFKMNIYRVLSTGNQNGFIQIVQDSQNSSLIHQNHGKDKIIKAFDTKAALSFLEYHNKGTDLLVAKQNFLRSSVGYLVASYILGLGDRHSGNIMVQKNGKFFHIDFGHFLGNFKSKFNIKRQRTPVTFTPQYAQVMGGTKSNDFARFEQYCGQAFNILRKNSDMIVNLLSMMVSADIPQLRSYNDIQYVVQKLDLDLSKSQAAQKISSVIRQTLQSQARNIDNAFHQWNRGG